MFYKKTGNFLFKTCELLTGFLSSSKLFLNYYYMITIPRNYFYSFEKSPQFKKTAQAFLLLVIKIFFVILYKNYYDFYIF